MRSERMEPRGVSASSRFHEDIYPTSEGQLGFCRTNLMSDHQGGGDGSPNLSRTHEANQLKPQSSSSSVLPSFSPNQTSVANGAQWESGLFSSSLSELFSKKLWLQRNAMLSSRPANTITSHYSEEEPFESLEEVEAQTIGNLLPDEDDLFAEVIGDVGRKSRANKGDELDDFDLFSSGGGMELDGEVLSSAVQRNFDAVKITNGERGAICPVQGEYPGGQILSRTLFVRNIDANIEDYELKALFEQYGDVQALYSGCKNRGFIVVSFYDIRAAQNAVRALQHKLLRQRKLNIHYPITKENLWEEDVNQGALLVSNLDSSIPSEELHQMFNVYGEIREIQKTAYDDSQIYIEFFDVRAAEAALRGLNGSEIGGKQLKLEPSLPKGARGYKPKYGQDDFEVRMPQSSFHSLSSANMARISPAIIASSSMDGGSFPALHNSVRSPINSFIEQHQSFSIPIGLPSSASVVSSGKPIGFQDISHSFDNLKMGNQSMPNLHPHSFPEYHEDFAGGSPYKSSRTFSEMVSNGSRAHDGFMASNVHAVSVDGFTGGVLGSSLNESCARPNHNLWNNSNTQQQNLSSGMIWPSSPSRINGIPQRMPPVSAFSRASPKMVNAPSSPVHHHIGSAPVMNSPFWDRRQAFVAESLESSGFHLGSPGSMGFPTSSPSHPMDIASHKMFAHVGGNRIDVNAANAVLRSPQQMSHLFPGRNPMVSVPGSFDSPNERYRNLSHRRSDTSSSNVDKKQYELDIDRILHGQDSRTTLMIKNIPNKYTSKMLLAAIDEHCKGTYDFIYLPIDFKNKCNVGYAFINLIDPQKIIPFHKAFNGKKWEKFNSEKVASLAYARIQGKGALIAHFQNSSLMNEDKRCRPILFHTDGPNAGDQEPFPMGANIRSRPGKPRTSSSDNHHNQSSSSVSENQDESPNGTNTSS